MNFVIVSNFYLQNQNRDIAFSPCMQDLLRQEITGATSLCSSDDEWTEESSNSPISDSEESDSSVNMEDIVIPSRFDSDAQTGSGPKSRRALFSERSSESQCMYNNVKHFILSAC